MNTAQPKKVKRYWFKHCSWCSRLMIIAELKMLEENKFYHTSCYRAVYDYKYDR